MVRRLTFILFFIIGLSLDNVAEAQTKFVCDTLEAYNIYFNQSSSKIDTNFRDNGFVISVMRQELTDLVEYSPDAIEAILIQGYSSPEGRERYNYRLSLRRAREMQELVRSIPALKDVVLELEAHGEDWESLVNKVRNQYYGENRELLLKILNSNVPYQLKKRWMKILDEDGSTWKLLMSDYMDDSRRASTSVSIRRSRALDVLPRIDELKSQAIVWPVKYYSRDTSAVKPSIIYPSENNSSRVPKLAIRTNLLVPALNVGLEIPLGNNWSTAVDYYYPWFWPNERNKDCLEFLGLNIEARYWLGRGRKAQDRLKGHSIGFYAAAGYYDFEKDWRGMQGEFVSPGIDYTYSTAVGRRKRINLQFTLAVGYIRSLGRTYNVYGDYGELYPDPGTVVWDYIGPTKAAVTLSVPLYGRKGGRR